MDEQTIQNKIAEIEKKVADLMTDANKQLAYLQGQKDAFTAMLPLKEDLPKE